MGGVEKSRFTGLSKTEEEELTCGICLAILVDPVVTHCCQQTYCSDCIKPWLKIYNTCPNDNASLDETGLMPACRVVINILNKLQVSCDYFANGCEHVVALENLKRHVKDCQHRPEAMCDVCGAKIAGEENDKSSHDCCKNLLKKIETLEKSNENLQTLNECLEANYQLLNKENINLVRDCKEKATKLERLVNINVKIKQQLSELKAKIMPLFEDIEANFDIKDRQLIMHANSNNAPKTKWSKIQIKIEGFQCGVFTQYSESRIIRGHPWRVMCQITFNKVKKVKCFGLYLQCNEKSASQQWSCNVSAEMSIISQVQGCDNFCRKFESVCSNEKRECGFRPFAPWNSILNPSNGLLKNGSLILEVVFSVV